MLSALLVATSMSGTDVLTFTSNQCVTAAGNSFVPQLSADGKRVVFLTTAPNLVTNVGGDWVQLVWRDLASGEMKLVTANANGACCQNESPLAFSISSNGQVVLFRTAANDVVAGDTNGAAEFFIRDMVIGTNQLIARAIDGGTANPSEWVPPPVSAPFTPQLTNSHALLSADARYVAFDSNGRNLHSQPDNNLGRDVFLRDLTTSSNTMVSVSRIHAGTPQSQGESFLTSMTPDARRIAFISTADDIAYGASNTFGDVFVRDLATNYFDSFHRVIGLTNYFVDPYRSIAASISADGRFVALAASSAISGELKLFHYALETQALTSIATNILTNASPLISADGRFVVFTDGTNILRWDAVAGTAQVVTVTTNGSALSSATARLATMTPDANVIAFVAAAAPLHAEASTNRQVYARDMTAGVTRLISLNTNGVACSGVDHFTTVSVSDDGTRFAFDTTASDLVPGDNNKASDVFVRDFVSGTTLLATPALPALPRTTGLGHAYVGANAFSADGRYLTFLSHDSDLVPGDTNSAQDAFVYDLATGLRTATVMNTNNSMFACMSADGKIVAIRQMNNSGYFGGGNGISVHRIVLHNRLATTNQIVVSAGGNFSLPLAPAVDADGSLVVWNGLFISPGTMLVLNSDGTTNFVLTNAEVMLRLRGEPQDAVFTPDGNFLLFYSTGHLTPNAPGDGELFAWNVLTREVRLVSWDSGSAVGVRGPIAISQNSRFTTYTRSLATYSDLYRYDFVTSSNRFITVSAANPAISADGRLIAFESQDRQVYVSDCDTGERSLISINSAGTAQANETARYPTISADGRFVTFLSAASNLVSGTTRWRTRLYVRDRLLGTTTLIASGNNDISVPIPSPDGRTIAFHTVASDLVPGDYNDKRDVFVVKLGVDTDNDGIDDDWERTYFNTLSRDGFADFDNDGASDRDEFLAGTDPTGSGSFFRVLTVTPLGGNSTRVIWNGNPARNYRVEFKDDLSATAWTPLNAPITWNGTTATVTDSTSTNAQRFYRAAQLP
jgi:Tol biopolymer transport system component